MKTRMPLLRATYMIKTFFKAKILYLIILLSYRFNKTKVIGESNIENLDSFILVSWHGKVYKGAGLVQSARLHTEGPYDLLGIFHRARPRKWRTLCSVLAGASPSQLRSGTCEAW